MAPVVKELIDLYFDHSVEELSGYPSWGFQVSVNPTMCHIQEAPKMLG